MSDAVPAVSGQPPGNPGQPWAEAWQDALYGQDGFYRRPEGPAGHFRTATHAGAAVLAEALVGLARRHGCSRLVDVGAGRGELLTALHRHDPSLALHGVDVVARPAGLPDPIGWSAIDAIPPGPRTLLTAFELLDNVTCPVLEADGTGALRVVRVDRRTGTETLGAPAEAADLAWCSRWWPGPHRPGDRVEVGRPRDDLWGALVTTLRVSGGGVLLAVDYAHHRDDRPSAGSLVGYREGRVVPPVPDGSCDVTADVALDAVAAAGEAAGARTITLTSQREALRDLGLTGRLDPTRPVTAAALARVSTEAELIAAHGLGGFGWLLQRVDPRA